MLFRRENWIYDEYTLEDALRVSFQRYDDRDDALAAIAAVLAALLADKSPQELERILSAMGWDWYAVEEPK